MGTKKDPPVTAATTVAATAYTQTVTCDLDLQSLRDGVDELLRAAAETGLGNARNVALTASVVLDVSLTPTGLQLTATWKTADR